MPAAPRNSPAYKAFSGDLLHAEGLAGLLARIFSRITA